MFLLPIIVTALGVFLLCKLRAFPLRHPIRTARGCIRAASRGGFCSLALALAGTLGVGNIFGVAISISLGGAGSVFWLFFSSVFASIIKYAEALVSVDSIKIGEGQGGMMYAIARLLPHGRMLGGIYAAICLLLAFVMGGAMQSAAAVSAVVSAFPVPRFLLSLAFLTIFLILVLGPRERIKRTTSVLVPLAATIYAAMAFFVIFRYFSEIPRVLSQILREAFSARALGAGVTGGLVASPIIRGYSTGILSNEAGAGTSSMAHASEINVSPSSAGLLGMCEVVVDTAVICMLTAFAILLPCRDTAVSAERLLSTLSSAFFGSEAMFCASVFVFALATAVCWYYYATVSARYLFDKEVTRALLPTYAASLLFGGFLDTSLLAAVSDVLLLLLTLLTAPVIIKSSDRIRALSELDRIL